MDDQDLNVDLVLQELANWNFRILRTSAWQIMTFILLSLYNMPAVWFMFIHYFTSDVNYVCNIPANVSQSDAIPSVGNGSSKTFEKCFVYKDFNKSSGIKIPCPMGFNHSPLNPSYTIVSSFNLYCDKEYLVSLSESVFYIGVLIGSLSCTLMGEKLGRKPVFLASFWLTIVVGIATFFAKNFTLFCFLRFLAGVLYQGYGVMGYILGVELYAAKDRALPCIFMNLFWGFGMIVLGILAYLIPQWRYLYLAITIPIIVTTSYYWFIDESLYWLVSEKKYKQANKIVKKACRLNRIKYDESLVLRAPSSFKIMGSSGSAPQTVTSYEKAKFWNVFHKTLGFAKRILHSTPYLYFVICTSLFLTLNTFVYNGLTLSASIFSSNIYINWVITSLIEFPVIIAIGFVVNKFGRKYPCVLSHFLLSITLFVFSFLNQEKDRMALNVFNHLSKFLTTNTYSIVWLYTPELFPTEIRSFSVGLTSSFGKLASIFSPTFYNLMLQHRRTFLLLLAVLCSLSAVVSLFLPETSDENLAEKIEDLPKLSVPKCKAISRCW